MIYCVVPKALADDLYPKLTKYYEDEENVTVIIDRRRFDRRARHASADPGLASQRRVVRDRRRARVPGELPVLADVSSQ
jgi:hypothetical protein